MYAKGGRVLPIRPAPLYPPRRKTQAKKLKKKVNLLAKAIKAEVRVLPTTSEDLTLTQAQRPYLLNGMATGDIDGTRDSAQIQMKFLQIRMNISADETKMLTNNEGFNIRCMIVYDKQPNGAVINTSQLLQTGGTAGRNFYAPTLFSYRKRFKILMDKNYAFSPISNTRNDATQAFRYEFAPRVIRIAKKINLPAQYITGVGAGDITDLIKGSLYFLTFADRDNTAYQVDVLTKLTYNP